MFSESELVFLCLFTSDNILVSLFYDEREFVSLYILNTQKSLLL